MDRPSFSNKSLLSHRFRSRRAEVFRGAFALTRDTTILDLGSEDGAHIAAVIAGTPVVPGNVHLADVAENEQLLERGARCRGFIPHVVAGSGPLPFADRSFDIVFCNSVIEHVTVPHERMWHVRSGRAFRAAAEAAQREFSDEVRRVGRQYFVQTPNKWFPIESHTRLPAAGWLPRPLLLHVTRLNNRFGVTVSFPDWLLLDAAGLRRLFPDAVIVRERFAGLTKSLIAIRAGGGEITDEVYRLGKDHDLFR